MMTGAVCGRVLHVGGYGDGGRGPEQEAWARLLDATFSEALNSATTYRGLPCPKERTNVRPTMFDGIYTDA